MRNSFLVRKTSYAAASTLPGHGFSGRDPVMVRQAHNPCPHQEKVMTTEG
jgi:hypothetical protein